MFKGQACPLVTVLEDRANVLGCEATLFSMRRYDGRTTTKTVK